MAGAPKVASARDGESRLSEAEIAVHWKDEALYYPTPRFIEQANLTDRGIAERFAEKNFPDCFHEYANLLSWDRTWSTTLDTSRAPFWKWFVGGKLNACFNCVDRHLALYGGKAAFIFVSEAEDEPPRTVTYQDLYDRVNEMAALLREFAGLRAGDRVTIHMPMVAELPITMLACARLGVIHSVVFAGFSGGACGARIVDSGSRVLITMDEYYRNGKLLDHQANAEVAVRYAVEHGGAIEKVLIWRRFPDRPAAANRIVEGRDYIVNEVLTTFRGRRVEPVSMPAEAPLFLMYTSGSTGQPKGCQHSTGGYLAYVAGTSKYIQDLHPTDVYWCLADIGWITGHSYIVYGPLALAATSVLYEGVPTFPDAGRPWRVAERLGVNIFHTSPTAIRALRKLGPDEPRKYHYRFKCMTTVGEPIEPEAWKWYYEVVGQGQAVVTDTWWQTENGGVLCSTKPALDPMKPGSAGPPLPGIYPVIFDEVGAEIPAGAGRAGNLCIRNPWPGIFQTIWGDPGRFVATYYAKYNRAPTSTDWHDWPYFAGDGAVWAKDGYLRILGRVDDVINVAGHRLGSKEIESACLTVPEVAEAAVVPVVDPEKGRVPEVYVALKPGVKAEPAVADRVSQAIETVIGKIARPRVVRIVPDMPKTRSGKIMRRVLAAISNKLDYGDITTLSNPEVVEQIRIQVQGVGPPAKTAVAPDDIARFGQGGD